MNRVIIVISLALIVNARLFTFNDFKDYIPQQQIFLQYNRKPINADIQVQTSCTNVATKDLSDKLVQTQIIYAGYLNVKDASSSSLAFIFYGSQKATTEADLSKYPTIIWLNGGPGSSSQLGNYLELGPVTFGLDGTQSANKFSWTTEYNVMFIDQPIGTGFGYAEKVEDIPINQDQVADQFLYALNQFFSAKQGCLQLGKLTQLKTSSWFLFGESYAGKFVPAIAEKWLSKTDYPIKLKGIGLGDGFTDPLSVISEMSGFGYNLGLIDYQERQKSESYALTGVMRIRNGDWLAAQQSFGNVAEYIVTQSGGMNIYNIFVQGTYDAQEKAMTDFLNLDKTKTVLGFNTQIPFDALSGDVYTAMSTDFMQRDCVARLENVLKAKLPVLVYNGQNDLIVPTPATYRLVNSLKFDAADEFNGKDFDIWKVGDVYAGYQKSAGSLELRLVVKAGHLVPMDQGAAALDMVKSFVSAHK